MVVVRSAFASVRRGMQSIAGIARRHRSPAKRRRRPPTPSTAVDSNGERLSRALVGAIVFAVAVASFTRVPLLPDIGADLSLSAGDLGLLTAAFGLGRLLTDLPAGRVASSVSPRRGLAGAGIALVAACVLLATAGSFEQALVAFALIGCASALSNTTGMYAFATAARAERRGANMALFSSALMSGQMVGPAVGGALAALAGWRGAIGGAAAIGVVVAVGSIGRLPIVGPRASSPIRASGADRTPAARTGHKAARVDREAPAAPAAPVAAPPSRWELAAIGAAPFTVFFAIGGLTQTLVPLIGGDELGLSVSTIGLALALGGAMRFPAAWVAGLGSDRYSRREVLVPALVLVALGAAVLALDAGTIGWLAAILVLAAGSSAISVAAAALADRVPADRLGHQLGVFRLTGDAGLLLGPILAGLLYAASGVGLAAGVTAALAAASALATLRLRD
jgi:predicted MFS family arabinose efflux permease